MWKEPTVERALMGWDKWRCSLVTAWVGCEGEPWSYSPSELAELTSDEITRLGFSNSVLFELYWICCVGADFSLDNERSFRSIVYPSWLHHPFDPSLSRYEKLVPGTRVHPLAIWDEADVEGFTRDYGDWLFAFHDFSGPRDFGGVLFLPSSHELYWELKKQRGRPRKRHGSGRRLQYADRVAVGCATLKDVRGLGYVQVARKFGLSVTHPYESDQSDTARHLVERGRRLILGTVTQV